MSKSDEIKRKWVEWALAELSPILFKGALLFKTEGTHGYRYMDRRDLADALYKRDLSLKPSVIDHVMDALQSVAPDRSDKSHLVAFGDQVWDMRRLEFVPNELDYVYSSDIAPNPDHTQAVRDYLLRLADGDEELAHDYLRLAAPLFMEQKPVGVIWVLGSGANGKSAFLDMLHMIIGKHFAELTIEMIEDGRSTPTLRGILGNIVRENSERRVEDAQKYKNLGAHESFPVRILGTHSVVTVDLNFHTILNANNIPAFADKTMGSTRRTLLVPFPATFTDDPGFKQRTFTPEFMGAFLFLVLQETHKIAEHGYQWSEKTRALQHRYMQDANTAEAYAHHLEGQGIVAFKNYTLLRTHYETWCSGEGTIPLGRTHLTRAIENVLHVVPRRDRDGEGTFRRYYRAAYFAEDVTWWENGFATAKADKLQPSANKLSEEW